MAETQNLISPQEIYGVEGFNGRKNDLIYCPPSQDSASSKDERITIYFGGDIQDFNAKMLKNKENKKYINWSLNNTAILLQKVYPQSHIIVVRPNRIELETFSCFDNFVKTTGRYGIPEFTDTHGSLEHLRELISTVILKKQQVTKNDDNLKLTIIGFSKGCVVLNQLLHEFHYWKNKNDETKMMAFIKKITDMYWLDGGHNGGKNTWMTRKELLETLANFDITVHVHVSPYQVRDFRRPWIGDEEKKFSGTLRALGVRIQRHIHFEHENLVDVEKHFQVINETFQL